MHVVTGAVEWVNDPTEVGDRRRAVRALFADKCMLRKPLEDRVLDRFLGGEVGGSDQIARPLFTNGNAPGHIEQNGSRRASRTLGYITMFFPIQPRLLVRVCHRFKI